MCPILMINSLTSSCVNWLCPVGFSGTASLSSIILILLQPFTACCVNMLLNTVDLVFFLCPLVEYCWLVVHFYGLTMVVPTQGRKLLLVCLSSGINRYLFFYIMHLWGDEIVLICSDEYIKTHISYFGRQTHLNGRIFFLYESWLYPAKTPGDQNSK